MDRTVRVKLNTTPEQAYALKETLAKFTNAFNAVCEYGWQNTERNGVRLHHETYYPIKAQCPMPIPCLRPDYSGPRQGY